MEYYHVLEELSVLFPHEVPGLSRKRDIYFTIDVVPRDVLVSMEPYRMSTLEFLELKMKLKGS